MRNLGPVVKAHTGEFTVRMAECVAAGLVICLFLLSSPAVYGQTLSGIQGTVTDQAGLPIPNAEITITNTDTGVRRNTTDCPRRTSSWRWPGFLPAQAHR